MLINKMIVPDFRGNHPNMNLTRVAYITIHETGNYNQTATARNHAIYQYNGSGGLQKSWHYTVDSDSIYQSFEDIRRCWHAGDGNNGPGNASSIGIEICVNSREGFRQACKNAAWLTSELLHTYGLDVVNVVQHNIWSGKNCPELLRSGRWGITWHNFLDMVRDWLREKRQQSVVLFIIDDETELIRGEIRNGVTFVEARHLLETMGYSVDWNDMMKAVIVT